MKHTSIFNTALRRLTIIYVWLAVLVTLTFTIPPLVAAERARQRLVTTWPDDAGFDLAPGDDRVFGERIQSFVQRRDTDYGRQLRTNLIEINGVILLLAVTASYFLARRSLEPLKEVLNVQEQFAAELAHELKTPLATVLLELESFARTHDKLTVGDKKELRQMARSIKDVGSLTEQTLSLMAVEYADQPTETVEFSLQEVAQEALDLIAPAAKVKGLKLKQPVTQDGVKIKGRRLQLRQLLTILLDNAVKFTPTGGQVSVAVNAEEGSVTVTDTGPGISTADQEKIFTRWYQVSGDQGGAGLGLAIARRIAEAHGGHLTVCSQPGQGASFTLTLPRS